VLAYPAHIQIYEANMMHRQYFDESMEIGNVCDSVEKEELAAQLKFYTMNAKLFFEVATNKFHPSPRSPTLVRTQTVQ
jgi:hypothetical protein